MRKLSKLKRHPSTQSLVLFDNVLDGEPELYGQEVTLYPGDMIRPERKFDSVEALTDQIRKDRQAAREWIAAAGKG